MGLIKDNKAATAGAHAARSASEGHTVLLYRFDVPWSSGGSSGPVSGAAEVIEEIEMEGWHLDQFAYDRAQSKNGAVLLVFRRPPTAGRPAPNGGFARAGRFCGSVPLARARPRAISAGDRYPGSDDWQGGVFDQCVFGRLSGRPQVGRRWLGPVGRVRAGRATRHGRGRPKDGEHGLDGRSWPPPQVGHHPSDVPGAQPLRNQCINRARAAGQRAVDLWLNRAWEQAFDITLTSHQHRTCVLMTAVGITTAPRCTRGAAAFRSPLTWRKGFPGMDTTRRTPQVKTKKQTSGRLLNMKPASAGRSG